MRAVLCKEFGPPESLMLEEVAAPVPEDGQVLVDVRACGVNFPDLLLIADKYQFKPPLPFSPGGEVAGVVTAVGDAVTRFKPGDRVIAAPGWGGFAEQAVAEENDVLHFPEEMDFVTAAAFLFTYGTSYYALKDRGRLAAGETLLVLGAAGGVGLAAVELGKAMGARVIAATSSEEKLALARAHGADDGFVYPAGPLDRDQQRALSQEIKAHTDGAGADVVYDPVGGDYSEAALRATNWEGRFLVIGFASGPIPKIPLNLTLLKGCSIVGVFWGASRVREPERHEQNVRELMELFVAGKVKPHIHATYPLEQAVEALNLIAERKVQGKVVVVTR